MRIAVGLVDADRERPRERGEGGLAVGTSRAPRLRLDLYLDSSHRGPGLVRDRADDDATRVVVGAGAGRERGGNQEILAHPELPPALAGPARNGAFAWRQAQARAARTVLCAPILQRWDAVGIES